MQWRIVTAIVDYDLCHTMNDFPAVHFWLYEADSSCTKDEAHTRCMIDA